MLGRGRRVERREERRDERATFGLRGTAERYQMREKLLSIGDDFWIEDGSGSRAFKVNGKAIASNETDGPQQHPGPVGGFYDSYNGDCVTVQFGGLRDVVPDLGNMIVSDDLGG